MEDFCENCFAQCHSCYLRPVRYFEGNLNEVHNCLLCTKLSAAVQRRFAPSNMKSASATELCANLPLLDWVNYYNPCPCHQVVDLNSYIPASHTQRRFGGTSKRGSGIARNLLSFSRKCFSLPHCYKPRHNFKADFSRESSQCYTPAMYEGRFTCPLDKALTVAAACPHPPETGVGLNSRLQKISPSEFKLKVDVMKKWFAEFTDDQKNMMLKSLLGQCGISQNHLLSVSIAPVMHYRCPSNCEDPFSWFPPSVSMNILSFLDPVDLCQCGQVCQRWSILASEPSLWVGFCRQPQWQLSRPAEQKQMITYRLPNGQIDWKQAFAERFRLHRNWLKGACHVRTFYGHTQGVFCVQFDDTRIVSGSSDKTIKVWNIRTNSPWSVMTLVGHSGTVRCLHLEGNRLVSGSSDCTIKVWDLSTQHTWSSIACKVTMVGHTDTVRCLQVDDEKVVSGSYDQSLKVWNIKTGLCKMTLRGHEGAVLCLQFDESKIISGSCDRTIKIWKLTRGRCIMTLHGHQDAVTCLQFDTSKIVSGSLDRTIKFWNLTNGECLSTLDWMKSEGHTGVVRCLQADRWKIVSAGDDKTLKVWSLETGQRLVTLRNHTDGVTCLQFNDSIIISGSYDQTVKLWDFSVC
ncbi:probable E3 ubiquitin ligase complex SCF subunit sconB [Limulus polyphemus]|uniref:Probable E3 ubiquitin ligase complex SCF subunit sconB n=1 Tax=Limulus polyphemus TaxID=6850 RepID=A0ABM1SQ99_LIMPO|nr:probable E3 ubiquitin ligase complex SCF subunit sconB [Limulus polyphemus]XP_022245803.1 probable E3 ubiquitin ligase complex SCF subunit sconB [Limulus polyphemus]XP_022245804.1 probable E3 ubiquitin ligase complex SCF subunit sconB [Limulus polyphemus]XP_022245805.1 probable E3 ubiquitin ligase complex SCF subunit sconB [Limulus polyphemus]